MTGKKYTFLLFSILSFSYTDYGYSQNYSRSVAVEIDGNFSHIRNVYIKMGEDIRIRSESAGNHYWYLSRPIYDEYDNYESCKINNFRKCILPIRYEAIELISLRGKNNFHIKEINILTLPGTRWIFHRQTPLEPGYTEFSTTEDPGDIAIMIRRDDTYIGYLTEMIGVPFVYFPWKNLSGNHQTDAHLGADCIALVLYGKRRMSSSVYYTAPSGIKKYTNLVPKNNSEQPIRAGDVLFFGFQTAVISRDTDPVGLLNDTDMVIHTFRRAAEEIKFADLPYREKPFAVYRWKTAMNKSSPKPVINP